jgi:anti-sigma regulatory factor (Ser/Thr protein kinase)
MCTELPEEKRSIMKTAANSILDIANNLLAAYRNQEQQTAVVDEAREPLLVSDLLVQLVSEKKIQYVQRSLKFDVEINCHAQFAFTRIQSSQFRRAMSNLINNAVDALESKSDGVITIKLNSDVEFIEIKVQDNGKGMNASVVEKMLSRKNFTEGKSQGHGIGLQQVWDTIDNNKGEMTVESIPGKGTTIQLTFPRIEAADWLADEIHLSHNSIILILDDDESIHGAWDARFKPFLERYSLLRSHHFMQGSELLAFVTDLNPEDKDRVIFLSDFELLGQDKNGLEIIEICKITNTALITSYYTDGKIREKARQLGIKILPKKMASIVPIKFHVPT